MIQDTTIQREWLALHIDILPADVANLTPIQLSADKTPAPRSQSQGGCMGTSRLTQDERDPTPLEFGESVLGTISTPGQQDKYSFTLPAYATAKVSFFSPLPGKILCLRDVFFSSDYHGDGSSKVGSRLAHGDRPSNDDIIEASHVDVYVLLRIIGHDGATSSRPYMLTIYLGGYDI
jgi:hypothetical protein